MIDTIQKWKSLLNLNDWEISIQKIDQSQVDYPRDCIGKEKYFIGIEKDHANKKGIIYHDVDLYEEAIVHELLHIKHPKKPESWINYKTSNLMLKYE